MVKHQELDICKAMCRPCDHTEIVQSLHSPHGSRAEIVWWLCNLRVVFGINVLKTFLFGSRLTSQSTIFQSCGTFSWVEPVLSNEDEVSYSR